MTDGGPLDPRAAAALLARSTDHAQRSMDISRPRLYLAWGIAWLVGLGVMWLSVRGQHPYRGPATYSAVLLGVLIVLALVVTMEVVIRATRGVQGTSEVQGRIYGAAWSIGFVMFFAVDGALARFGAGDEVLGILGPVGPLLITSLIYILGAALWVDWPMLIMGCWLAVVAVVGAWTGPVAVLAIAGFGAGGGFLLMAAALAYRRRH